MQAGDSGGISRGWRAWKCFLTTALICPYPEAAGIDDEEKAEAKDERSHKAPHQCQHQIGTGLLLSTRGL